VVGLAAGHEEARERIREDDRIGLGAVGVEVTQGLADVAATLHRPRQLKCGPTPRARHREDSAVKSLAVARISGMGPRSLT
jgi:hypothetical protein